jgi:signal recognition particle subunit SRP54
MFETLTERLSKTVRGLTGRGRISEKNIRDTARQIRMALLEADVALPVARAFVERVRQRALGEEVARSLNPGQTFTKIVHDEIVALLGTDAAGLSGKGRPAIIMLVGLQGAGKTTTAAKLARHLESSSRGEIMLTSVDVHRPAAREQLSTLGAELDIPVFESVHDDARSIVVDACEAARRRGLRWLIVDTAGRLHVDEQMMEEVRSLVEAVSPGELLFVIDSMGGQDALNSARAFHEALPLTGVILTKTDGDARGGAALSVREVTGLPIKFIGTGEKADALERFVPDRFAARILGQGDVVGLVEQVQEKIDREKMEKVAARVKQGKSLTLEDFRGQLEQIMNLGGLEAIVDKLPGSIGAPAPSAGLDPKAVRRQIAIIDSMTCEERLRPSMIDGSRKRRIARGSGQAVQDVNRLLKQHKQLVKTMKQVSRGGMQRMLGAAMRGGRPRTR